MCAIIAALYCTCLHLYRQLHKAHQLVENTNKLKDENYHEYIVTSGEWVSVSDYEDLLHELSIADDLIFYVEERLDSLSIEDYLNSKEREIWAKYH